MGKFFRFNWRLPACYRVKIPSIPTEKCMESIIFLLKNLTNLELKSLTFYISINFYFKIPLLHRRIDDKISHVFLHRKSRIEYWFAISQQGMKLSRLESQKLLPCHTSTRPIEERKSRFRELKFHSLVHQTHPNLQRASFQPLMVIVPSFCWVLKGFTKVWSFHVVNLKQPFSTNVFFRIHVQAHVWRPINSTQNLHRSIQVEVCVRHCNNFEVTHV